MNKLMGEILERATLIGKQIKCRDGWQTITEVNDCGRVIIFGLADGSVLNVGLWQNVEIRDEPK